MSIMILLAEEEMWVKSVPSSGAPTGGLSEVDYKINTLPLPAKKGLWARHLLYWRLKFLNEEGHGLCCLRSNLFCKFIELYPLIKYWSQKTLLLTLWFPNTNGQQWAGNKFSLPSNISQCFTYSLPSNISQCMDTTKKAEVLKNIWDLLLFWKLYRGFGLDVVS